MNKEVEYCSCLYYVFDGKTFYKCEECGLPSKITKEWHVDESDGLDEEEAQSVEDE